MNYKKSNGSKILSGILAVLLVLVIAAGVVGVGYMSDWFTDWTKFEQEEQPANEEQGGEETANGGAVISGSVENGVSLMSAKIATADYAANDISPLAETAYTLTAKITPSDAADKSVDWSVAFVNPSSSWASGKTVTDYVTITPTSDGALTANVECVAAFGEQIVVTVTSRVNSSATATCTVDYVKKITSVDVSLEKDGVADNNIDWAMDGYDYEIICTPVYSSVYTIDDSFTSSVSFKGTKELLDYLNDRSNDLGLSFSILTVSGNTFSTERGWLVMTLYEYELVVVGEYVNDVLNAIADYNGNVLEVTVEYTGTYSNYTATQAFANGEADFSVSATGATLNRDSIIF